MFTKGMLGSWISYCLLNLHHWFYQLLKDLLRPTYGCDLTFSVCRQFFIEELEHSREFYNNQNRLLKLLFAMYNLLAANSELVCYFIIVLNNVVSASVISLFLPILVFLWAMLSVPRPSKKFWMTAIVYTEVWTLIAIPPYTMHKTVVTFLTWAITVRWGILCGVVLIVHEWKISTLQVQNRTVFQKTGTVLDATSEIAKVRNFQILQICV